MARKTGQEPYSERTAKAEVRAALQDLERVAARLRETEKRLKTLPSYKRIDAASDKGDDDADGFAWSLAGACGMAADELRDQIACLRKDLRATDASLEAASKKRALQSVAAAKKGPKPPWSGFMESQSEVLASLAVSTETFADPRVIASDPKLVSENLRRLSCLLAQSAGVDAMEAERRRRPREAQLAALPIATKGRAKTKSAA